MTTELTAPFVSTAWAEALLPSPPFKETAGTSRYPEPPELTVIDTWPLLMEAVATAPDPGVDTFSTNVPLAALVTVAMVQRLFEQTGEEFATYTLFPAIAVP